MKVTKLTSQVLGTTNTTTTYCINSEGEVFTISEAEFIELRNLVREPNTSFPQYVITEIRAGRKIDAIKALRELRGLGLKEAKDAVEKWADDNGVRWPTMPPSSY